MKFGTPERLEAKFFLMTQEQQPGNANVSTYVLFVSFIATNFLITIFWTQTAWCPFGNSVEYSHGYSESLLQNKIKSYLCMRLQNKRAVMQWSHFSEDDVIQAISIVHLFLIVEFSL